MRLFAFSFVTGALLVAVTQASESSIQTKWFPVSEDCEIFLTDYDLNRLLGIKIDGKKDCFLVSSVIDDTPIWSFSCSFHFEIFTKTQSDCDKVQGTLEGHEKVL